MEKVSRQPKRMMIDLVNDDHGCVFKRKEKAYQVADDKFVWYDSQRGKDSSFSDNKEVKSHFIQSPVNRNNLHFHSYQQPRNPNTPEFTQMAESSHKEQPSKSQDEGEYVFLDKWESVSVIDRCIEEAEFLNKSLKSGHLSKNFLNSLTKESERRKMNIRALFLTERMEKDISKQLRK